MTNVHVHESAETHLDGEISDPLTGPCNLTDAQCACCLHPLSVLQSALAAASAWTVTRVLT